MRAILHEVRQTLSQLRQHLAFTAVAAGILGLGLGVTLYMLGVMARAKKVQKDVDDLV